MYLNSFKKIRNVRSSASSSAEICDAAGQMSSGGRIQRKKFSCTSRVKKHSEKKYVREAEGIASVQKYTKKISASGRGLQTSYVETPYAFQSKEGARNSVQRCAVHSSASLPNMVGSRNRPPAAKRCSSKETTVQNTSKQINYVSGSGLLPGAASSTPVIIYMLNPIKPGDNNSTTDLVVRRSSSNGQRLQITTTRIREKYKAYRRPPPEALDGAESTSTAKEYSSYQISQEVKNESIRRSPYVSERGTHCTKEVRDMTINYSSQHLVMKRKQYPVNSLRTQKLGRNTSYHASSLSHRTNRSQLFAKAEENREKIISKRVKRKNVSMYSHCSKVGVPNRSVEQVEPQREFSSCRCVSRSQPCPLKNPKHLDHVKSPRSLVPGRRHVIQRNVSSARAQNSDDDDDDDDDDDEDDYDDYGCLGSSPICIPAVYEDDDEDE